VITWAEMMSEQGRVEHLRLVRDLVALADGLSRVGFIPWFATTVVRISVAFRSQGPGDPAADEFPADYLFASVKLMSPAVLPVLLAVGPPYRNAVDRMALLLCLQLGIMGVITPYGTGPSRVLRFGVPAWTDLLEAGNDLRRGVHGGLLPDHRALGDGR